MAIIHNTSKSKTVNHHISSDSQHLFIADFDCHNGYGPSSVHISLRPEDRRRNRQWRRLRVDEIRNIRAVLDAVLEVEERGRPRD